MELVELRKELNKLSDCETSEVLVPLVLLMKESKLITREEKLIKQVNSDNQSFVEVYFDKKEFEKEQGKMLKPSVLTLESFAKQISKLDIDYIYIKDKSYTELISKDIFFITCDILNLCSDTCKEFYFDHTAYPEILLQTIIDNVRSNKNVTACYIKSYKCGSYAGYVVALDINKELEEEKVNVLLSSLASLTSGAVSLSTFLTFKNLNNPNTKKIFKNTKPFYTKKKK